LLATAGLGGCAQDSALLLGLAATASGLEGAVRYFDHQAAYLPRLSTILMAIAATPRAYLDGFLRTSAETLIGL